MPDVGDELRTNRELAKCLIDYPIRLVSRRNTYDYNDRSAGEGEESASSGRVRFQFHGEREQAIGVLFQRININGAKR